MKLFDNFGDIGGGLRNAYSSPMNVFKTHMDPGSVLFGGVDTHNSLGMERQGTKGGLFGDRAQGIDWMGSPITAGTNLQGPARLGAILYGGYSALGGLGGGAGSGAAGNGMDSVGLGASPGAGAGAGGAAAGSSNGAIASGSAGGAASSGSWWNQLRSPGMGQRQQQPYQPTWTMFQDDADTQRLLAELLRRY